MTKTDLIIKIQQRITIEGDLKRNAVFQVSEDRADARIDAYEYVLELLEDLDD